MLFHYLKHNSQVPKFCKVSIPRNPSKIFSNDQAIVHPCMRCSFAGGDDRPWPAAVFSTVGHAL